MKKGMRKSLELAWKMLEWAYKNDLYANIDATSRGMVTFRCQPKSYKNVHLFKREFPKVGTFKKGISSMNTWLNYDGNCGDLHIGFYGVEELPPSCKIVREEVTIPETLVPEHIEPEHTEIKTRIVCDNGDEDVETVKQEEVLNEN